MILLLIFLLIPSVFSVTAAEGTCMDAPFAQKYSSASSCSYPYILNSAMPSFPTNLMQGTAQLTLDLLLKINTICAIPGDRIELFTLTIETAESGKVPILNIANIPALPKYRVTVNYGGGNVTLYNPTGVLNAGDTIAFLIKMDLSLQTNITNARSIFRFPAFYDSSSMLAPKLANTNWKFDSSTKFYFCANINGVATAYCEILGFSTWYVFETVANGANYVAGLYPVIQGFYKINEGSGSVLHDFIGNIGNAYLGSSTSSTSDPTHSPIWQPSESSLKFNSTNQYITIPAFSFNGLLGDQKSFSLNFFMKISTGSSGTLFQYLSSDYSQIRAAVTLQSNGTLKGRLGNINTTSLSSQVILPGIWYQVTITFISAAPPYRSYSSIHLGTTMIANIYGAYALVPFGPTDKVFIGQFTAASSILMTNLRIYVPGAYLVTDLQTCSYPAVTPSCGVSLGVPNPGNCFSCPEGTYMKNTNCVQNCYFYSDDVCRMKCAYPYIPMNDTLASYCDFRCDSSSYLYPNGSCLSSCSSPSIKYQNLSTEWYCKGPCSDSNPYYYPDQKRCMSYCTQTYDEDFSLFYPQCIPAKTSETIKSTIEVTDKAGAASRAVTQATTALSSGSPTGISASVAGKIFSNIKYLNISYSVGLEEALMNWGSSFISLEFMPDMPKSIQNKIVNQPVPYMFEKYDIESSFLLNFWNNLLLLVFLAIGFFVIKACEYMVRAKLSEKILNKVIVFRAMLQNFLLTQLYSIYGDVLFYTTLEYRSIDLREGLTSISFSSGVILTIIMLAGLVLHFFFLRKYQRIKTKSSPEALDKFIKSNEGNFVLFRDFKDRLLIQQSFLLLLTARDLACSLIITTLFRHPLAQSIVILILNLLMIAYLILKSPFSSLFDSIQQFFYEFITLTVSVNVLILAIMDAIDSRGKQLRTDIGNFIIIINLCFNFGALGFMLVKGFLIIKEIYKEYKAKRNLKRNPKIKHKRPEKKSLGHLQQASTGNFSAPLSETGDLQNSTIVKDIEDLNESITPFNVKNLVKSKRNKIFRKERSHFKNKQGHALRLKNNPVNVTISNDLQVIQVQDLEISSVESKDSFQGVLPQSTISSQFSDSNIKFFDTQPEKKNILELKRPNKNKE